MSTVDPVLAAVGDRACGLDVSPAGRGKNLEAETERDVTIELVDAELLRRSRLKPDGSGAVDELGRTVDGPSAGDGRDDTAAAPRTLPSPLLLVSCGPVLSMSSRDVDFGRDTKRAVFCCILPVPESRSDKGTSISGIQPRVQWIDSPSLISFADQFSSPSNPPASRICIHRRRICPSTPSLAPSTCCRLRERGDKAVCSVCGSTFKRMAETRD